MNPKKTDWPTRTAWMHELSAGVHDLPAGIPALAAALGGELLALGPMESKLGIAVGRTMVGATMMISLLACTGIDPSARTVVLDDLEHQSESNGVWQSAEWDTPWLAFPAKQSVTIEHGLGITPRLVQVYIDFDRAGCDRDATTTALLASGTLARISQVNQLSVTVRNDTKEDYCLRLVAQ